jgi:molecular chaperone DnaK
VSQAVISVPAYFNESQRRATREAGELAGLYVPRIIPEPTAAALAFGLGAKPETVAVYDLGGGTFDISILRIEHGLFRVKAIGGDTHLGGDDFDQALVEWMNKEFEAQYPGLSIPIEEDARVRSRLREEARRVKVALSNFPEQPVQLPDLRTVDGRLLCLETTVTRAMFEQLIQHFIDRSLELVEQTLNAARVRPEDISQFLLVGGQTRTPAVKAAISQRFGRPLNDSVQPEEAVARGAAILGARLCGYLKEQVALWDVNPLSLGVELADGRLDVIIQANEPIPVEKWRRGPQAFTTQRDGQKSIRFKIFQGERPIAADNAYIGEVILPLATTRRTGEHRINCLFKVDHNGILTVRATSADADSKPAEIVLAYGAMSPVEVDAKLKEAAAHRTEDEITRRIFSLREQLAQLRAATSNHSSNDPIVQRLARLEAAIDARDPDRATVLLDDIRRTM